MRKKTNEEFISESIAVHGDTYDYTSTVYLKATSKVTIKCKVHGEFIQSPRDHIKGSGCPKCIGRGLSTGEWIDRFKSVHGDKFDYNKFTYTSPFKKEQIICKVHGVFMQNTHNHSQGQQCPKCSISEAWIGNCYYNVTNANRHKDDWVKIPCKLYVVRMSSLTEDFYKIGITNQELTRRFREHDTEYTVEEIHVVNTNRYNAILLEAELHNTHSELKYTPDNKFGGHTECFTHYKGLNNE